MTAHAAMISRKAMILSARMTFKMTYPGPAKDSRSFAIMIAGFRCLSLQIEEDMEVQGNIRCGGETCRGRSDN